MLININNLTKQLLGINNLNTRYLYELLDPRDNLPRYVGITKNLKNRYNNHIIGEINRKCPKSSWIKSLKKLNLLPIMRVISIVHKDDIEQIEIDTIKHYREKYPKLKNLSDGGSYGSKSILIKSREIPIVGKNLITGNIITFKSSAEAGRNGFSSGSINSVLNNKTLSSNNYVWVYQKDEILLSDKFDKIKYKKENKDTGKRSIIGLNDKNETITFNSLSEAELSGFQHSNIIRSIKTGIRSREYHWKYLNEY